MEAIWALAKGFRYVRYSTPAAPSPNEPIGLKKRFAIISALCVLESNAFGLLDKHRSERILTR
jgi:hypothetical protein